MIYKRSETAPIKKVIPSILAISIFMEMLDATILNTALPSIAKDLGESPLNMQNAIVSYVLTLAIVMPLNGFLSDKFGTKRVFITALSLFGLGSLFCALSQNLLQLVLSRVLQGIGGSLMNPVGRLILIKSYKKDEFLRAFNYAVTPALIGPILGPLVGGYLVQYLSWHWIFIINIPVAIFCIFLSLRHMPNYKDAEDTFDFKGFLIFAAASLLFSISLELLGHPKNLTPVLTIITAGMVMLYLYFRYAKKRKHALYPISLFSIRTFRIGIIGNLITRIGIGSIPLLLPLLIQVGFGQSAVISGWIIAPMAITAMLGKSSSIRLLNKFSYRNTLRLNTAFIGIFIIALAIPGIHTSIYWFIPLIAILGFFNSIQFTAMNSITISDLRNYQTSSGNSLLSVNQQLAVGFGIALGSVVLRVFQRNLGEQEIHLAFRYTFIAIGAFTILAGLVFRRLHSSDGENLRSKKVINKTSEH